jgi:excisionase family DNA binding protein
VGDEPVKDTFSTSEVAVLCQVSRVTVWKWIKRGELYAVRNSQGHYAIPRETLRRFLSRKGYPVDPTLFQPSNRVLIIDDEPPVVEVVSRVLYGLDGGIRIATAEDGFEAGLQMAAFRPDLLILDLMMPRMNGFHVCRLVRQDPTMAHTRILIITGYGSRDNVVRALAAGADDVYQKPVELRAFKRRVGALLNS